MEAIKQLRLLIWRDNDNNNFYRVNAAMAMVKGYRHGPWEQSIGHDSCQLSLNLSLNNDERLNQFHLRNMLGIPRQRAVKQGRIHGYRSRVRVGRSSEVKEIKS